MNKLETKDVVKYMCFPGIVPRIKEFSSSGFSFLAFLIVHLYVMVRILPATHPYYRQENIGKYGIRHVISEAFGNIPFNKQNIDKICIFATSIMAFAVMIVQIALVVFALFTGVVNHSANAQGFDGSMFKTQYPQEDVALNLLDQVFGVKDFFCAEIGGSPCTETNADLPWPIHSALHEMFRFYSTAMLLFGVIIFLYYVSVVVGESATTGVPFGQRFNRVWAPLRLVVAIGLLVPMANGLSSAQYIVLAAAKFGSGLATNSWIQYNLATLNPIGEDSKRFVAKINAPSIQPLVAFMTLVKTCQMAYRENYKPEEIGAIESYLIIDDTATLLTTGDEAFISDWIEESEGDLLIRFGEKDEIEHNEEKGDVFPYCGELTIHISNLEGNPGALYIQEVYLGLVLAMFDMSDTNMINVGGFYAGAKSSKEGYDYGITTAPDIDLKKDILEHYQGELKNAIAAAYQSLVNNSDNLFNFDTADIENHEILNKGWGGGGIWYNKIAQENGVWVSSVKLLPSITQYPDVMEKVRQQKTAHDPNVSDITMFQPTLSTDEKAVLGRNEINIATSLYSVMKYMYEDNVNVTKSRTEEKFNIIKYIMGALFDSYGLYDMTKNEALAVHPLAQMSALGKSMLDAAIRNLMAATIFSAGGGAVGTFNIAGGKALEAISGIFLSLFMMGIAMGFLLFYILPFLPFIYFYFAVLGWVKGIFEAMVGVPLWALAHLQISGPGLPGQQAAQGYVLILEVFIRPVLIILGLLASVVVFSSMVRVLHAIFDLVTSNLTGFSAPITEIELTGEGEETYTFRRGIIDEFFFTVMYVIIVYMAGTSSFKLIDIIPNQILRWFGSGARSFSDDREDPTQGLVQYAVMSGEGIAGKMGQSITQAGGTFGTMVGRGLGGKKEPGGEVGNTPPDKKGKDHQSQQAQSESNRRSTSGRGGRGGR